MKLHKICRGLKLMAYDWFTIQYKIKCIINLMMAVSFKWVRRFMSYNKRIIMVETLGLMNTRRLLNQRRAWIAYKAHSSVEFQIRHRQLAWASFEKKRLMGPQHNNSLVKQITIDLWMSTTLNPYKNFRSKQSVRSNKWFQKWWTWWYKDKDYLSSLKTLKINIPKNVRIHWKPILVMKLTLWLGLKDTFLYKMNKQETIL